MELDAVAVRDICRDVSGAVSGVAPFPESSDDRLAAARFAGSLRGRTDATAAALRGAAPDALAAAKAAAAQLEAALQ